jgi:hypothetical protein
MIYILMLSAILIIISIILLIHNFRGDNTISISVILQIYAMVILIGTTLLSTTANNHHDKKIIIVDKETIEINFYEIERNVIVRQVSPMEAFDMISSDEEYDYFGWNEQIMSAVRVGKLMGHSAVTDKFFFRGEGNTVVRYSHAGIRVQKKRSLHDRVD